jgi:hypothetical protein
MAVLELTKEQIFDLIRQMPAEQKREMLLSLAANSRGSDMRLIAVFDTNILFSAVGWKSANP